MNDRYRLGGLEDDQLLAALSGLVRRENDSLSAQVCSRRADTGAVEPGLFGIVSMLIKLAQIFPVAISELKSNY
jgi:hypothetical protein